MANASPIQERGRRLGFVFEFADDCVEGRELAGQLLKFAGGTFAGSVDSPCQLAYS